MGRRNRNRKFKAVIVGEYNRFSSWPSHKLVEHKAFLSKELKLVDDVLKFRKDQYNNAQHDAWRKAVYAKYNNACQFCGATRIKAHAHHVYSKFRYPTLAYDVRNGVCLCEYCHLKRVHEDGLTCDEIDLVKDMLRSEVGR
jgi:hypothetical protein